MRSEQLQIGDWRFDPVTSRLSREGMEHKLEPRAGAVLAELAARPGQVIANDELLALVWGRVAISHHSVAIVISQLRRAFGEPGYIETVNKRGYRLVAPIMGARRSRFQFKANRSRVALAVIACAALSGGAISLTPAITQRMSGHWASENPPPPLALSQFVNMTGDARYENVSLTLTRLVADELIGTRPGLVVRWSPRRPGETQDAELDRYASWEPRANVVTGVLTLSQRAPVLTVQIGSLGECGSLWSASYAVDNARSAPLVRQIARELARRNVHSPINTAGSAGPRNEP